MVPIDDGDVTDYLPQNNCQRHEHPKQSPMRSRYLSFEEAHHNEINSECFGYIYLNVEAFNYLPAIKQNITQDILRINSDEEITTLITEMQLFKYLKGKLQENHTKLTQSEFYFNDLKTKLQVNISYFNKYSSFWMNKIINNQMNKQILIHSVEYQQEVLTERAQLHQDINQALEEIFFILNQLISKPNIMNICDEFIQAQEESENINNRQNKILSSSDLSDESFIDNFCKENSNDLNINYEENAELLTIDTSFSLDREQENKYILLENQLENVHVINNLNFRAQVAFAGFEEKVGNMIVLNDQSNSRNQLKSDQNAGIVAVSTAVVLASNQIPGIDLVSLGCIGVYQSIINFTNPHRNLSSTLREQRMIVSQVTVCGGLGLAGATIGQALIPVPGLGAVIGGLVMELFGVFLSSQIKDWNNDRELHKKINFMVDQNAEINDTNIEQYYDILDIKKNSLTEKITLPKSHLIHQIIGSDQEIQYNKNSEYGNKEKLQVYLLYALHNLGTRVFTQNQENLGEELFAKSQVLQNELEAFTEYFDFDYLSIGKNLHFVYNELKGKLSLEEIAMIIEEIDPSEIDGNNDIRDELGEQPKKLCRAESLRTLLKSKNMNETIIDQDLPNSILTLDSTQILDLWATYICIQLLNPSFVLLDLFMIKVNYELEQKNIFLINTLDQYYPIFKKMFNEQ